MENPYESPKSLVTATNLQSFEFPLWMKRVVWLHPIFLVTSIFSCWLTAWAVLGHMPRPMLDDPKSLGGLVNTLYVLSGLFMVTMPVAWVLGLAVVLLDGKSGVFRRPVYFPLFVLLWVGIIYLMRSDPLELIHWYFD